MDEHDLAAPPWKSPPWKSPLWIALAWALSIGAGVGFVGSVLWIYHRNRLVTDAFQLLFAGSMFGWLVLLAVKVWLKSRSAQPDWRDRGVTTYSFPRRFGLGTLLIVTLAFGILTALCRWFEWPAWLVLGILLFFGLVSAAQFALDRAPREASVLTGSVVLAGCFFALRAANDQRMAWFTSLDVVFFVATCAFFGGLVGYCTGTLVGSVFMFMAGVSSVLKKPHRPIDQI